MKKIIIGIFALSLIILAPVMAQDAVTTSAETVEIKSLSILGKGIAASPSDPLDFMIVKFGLGKVVASVSDTEVLTGVVKFDDQKYRVKNVVIGDGSATGDIYDGDTQVGSFELTSIMKDYTEVWAGTTELNGNTYHTYIIEGKRVIKAKELKEKVVDYCDKNEDDNCKDRLDNYCETNPEDSRCKGLFRAYCMKDDNMEDTRCRHEFRDFCEENPTNDHCIPFALQRSQSYCEDHSDSGLCKTIAEKVTNMCEGDAESDGCGKVREMIEENPKLLEKATELREKIEGFKATISGAVDAIKSRELMKAGGN